MRILRVFDVLFDLLIADKRVYLFIVAFFLYICNPYVYVSSDTLPTQLLPLSIIREHDLDLDEFAGMNLSIPLDEGNTLFVGPLDEGNTLFAGGRLVSRYPIFTALIATPFYVPFVLMGYPMESYFIMPAKLSSAFVVALSVAFLYTALGFITDKKRALYCSLIYAFGTCAWSISSRELWQHGSVQLFLTVSLYLLLRGLREERFIPYAGFSMACAVASRPASMLLFFVITAYIFFDRRKKFLTFVLWSAPPFLFLFWYSWSYLGSVFALGQGQSPLLGWSTPLLYGLCSLLFSPSKGLFVYSPVLLLSFVGIYRIWKDNGRLLFKYLSLAVFAFILMWSKWWAWHGGTSYGYRMLVDITPVLCLFLVPVFEKYDRNRWFRLLLVALVVYSVAIQILGVFFEDGSWDKTRIVTMYPLDGIHSAFWSMQDNQLVYYFRKMVDFLEHLS